MTPVPKVFEFVDQRYNSLEYINNHIVSPRNRIHYNNICDKIIFYIRFYCFRKVMVLPPYFRTIAKIFKILDWK